MQVTKENLKINIVKENQTQGTYTIEPLPTGFGHTLGNGLRRVLLTSIEGAAITQVKISGTNHQFTTIPGVKEDVVEITLNLKKVRVKLHSKNPVVATLKKKGGGTITAGDIQVSSEAEILNKDLHIATLADSKTELNIELLIEPGVGYSAMEERQTSKVGVIVLDALFSPIINATYEVEPTRFADRIDLDKVTLNVETDGSIAPKQAIVEATKIVKGYYEVFEKWETTLPASAESKEETVSSKTEDVAIEELPLQTRTINALKKYGIDTLHELAKRSDDEIADIKNLGEKSLEEIKALLLKEGLR